MNHNKSTHILGTSANLLGFCFVVLTSSKITKMNEASYIDEGATLAVVCFMSSCLFSFLAIRSQVEQRGQRLEKLADVLFLCGLIILFLTTILIAFNII
ncbi:hypothetical protein [Nubsella zeaxanthinifaciens]|jgi:hypothetical protein|uniref:hypothetical protein n=1 Tax=Nubsella zeaxanthinifaciens TaxID=392412 RepID=UPI000DE2FE45|nr:hypothetical protein [Nubsella zeaxanthinifaciens]